MSFSPSSGLVFALAISPLAGAEQVRYGRDVLPILSEKCLACHGPDEKANDAGLRLDLAEEATGDLGGYAAIVPGKPEESEMMRRIGAKDPDEKMPPRDSHLSLSEAEVGTLRKWIAEGAVYEKHWAFVPPVKGEAEGIDELVAARLAREGLERSEPAGLETLCRRIFLDVIGLPPSPGEIDAFLAEAESDLAGAVRELVDGLLARPAYAENWARPWLDIARYADSQGFEKDLPREQWAWRDWVIDALDRDMPYDRFVIEQVAGDLLPERTQENLVASGFLRNGMVNEEGAIVYEQFRIEGIVDRMDALGKATLGLTVQCAQCHTHKFDPITHDEYFGMFAFLNETHEAKSWVYDEAQFEKIAGIRAGVERIGEELKVGNPDWETELAGWIAAEREREKLWRPLDPVEHVWEGGLNHPEKREDHSVVIFGHPTTTGQMFMIFEPGPEPITALRLEALRDGDLPFGGPGRSRWGTFAISELEVLSRGPGEEAEWEKVRLVRAMADFEEPEKTLEEFFKKGDEEKRRVGPVSFLIDGDEETAWRGDRGPILRHAESAAVVIFAEPLRLPEGGQIKVRLVENHGGKDGETNQQLGRLRIGVTGAAAEDLRVIDHASALAVSQPESEWSEEDRRVVFRAWRKCQPEFSDANRRVEKLEAGYPEAQTSVLHLEKKERVTNLLERGVWNQPGHEVKPHVPAVLSPLEKENPTRLDFAKWLVDRGSPVAARVEVNRVWQAVFGAGLVETPDDFGKRSPRPEHLETLDWLAVDFMESGWSRKHLLRRILLSETYAQDSRITSFLREKDPKNRLLARGPRFRAAAEVIRDSALAASGLLLQKTGGPSIFPPVPPSLLEYNFTKPDYWHAAKPPERYRRSLYVFRKRSMPDPVLSNFDAPTADFSCARRMVSNSPLAALVPLNEPVFVEAARAMALRILREGGENFEARVDYGYRLVTGRHARAEEIESLRGYRDSQAARFENGELSAEEIVFGEEGGSGGLPDGVDPREAAEFTLISRVLLNLDETLSKP